MPNIYIVDINSLYPHVMISHNISPDTLVGYISGEKENQLLRLLNMSKDNQFYQKFAPARTAGRYFGLCYAFNLFENIEHEVFNFTTAYETIQYKGFELLELIKNKNLIVTVNGAIFRSDSLGIWTNIEKDLLEKRNIYKKAGDNVKQLAYKILANALYGVFGATGFMGFNPYIAEAITITGQFTTISLSMFINQKMNNRNISINIKDFIDAINQYDGTNRYLLYRDTDSLFFYNKLEDFNWPDFIAEVGYKLYNDTTLKYALNKDFFLQYSPKVKIEFIGDVAIFTGRKKRYFIYDTKTDKYKIAGFINNSYPQFLNDLIIKTLKNIANKKLNKTNKQLYLKKIKEKIDEYLDTDLLSDLYQIVAWKTDNIKFTRLEQIVEYDNIDTILKNITPNVFSMIVYNTIIGQDLFGLHSKAYSLKAKYNTTTLLPLLKERLNTTPGKLNIIMKKIASSNIVAFEDFNVIKPYINLDSINNLVYERISSYLEENIFEVL